MCMPLHAAAARLSSRDRSLFLGEVFPNSPSGSSRQWHGRSQHDYSAPGLPASNFLSDYPWNQQPYGPPARQLQHEPPPDAGFPRYLLTHEDLVRALPDAFAPPLLPPPPELHNAATYEDSDFFHYAMEDASADDDAFASNNDLALPASHKTQPATTEACVDDAADPQLLNKMPLMPIPEDSELRDAPPTPKIPAQPPKPDIPPVLSVYGGPAVIPPPPANANIFTEEAWHGTWRWWTRDAVAMDGWRKLCWRQIGHSIDPATGSLIGGPLELAWTDYGAPERVPAASVSDELAAAARRRFRELYRGAVPPLHHHQQPVYTPLYKVHVPLGVDYRSQPMWLY